MRLFIHLFEVAEANSCRGLADEMKGHVAIMCYSLLLNALLDGDEFVRTMGSLAVRWKNGKASTEQPNDFLINTAEYIARAREHDPLVAAMLAPIDPMGKDEATYAIELPDGMTRDDFEQLRVALVAASETCAPVYLPWDVEAAWRRTISEAAARHNIPFASVRPQLGGVSELAPTP